ncbi:ABC transporter substrate-binding protein [Salinarimonas ramus]|uniref:Sugar ABC transporter substrate-binding protein n=1 Tax=Salinarimonas ramus TaxID=690164 RepID=A0A917Q693_9HYPH|nr:ABC transporter substrate-binding protein [Salinarimonas ramus]GGK21817.1 sugar ABC transporter substrate-binding protein [Salinarimonas ramus]
MTKLITTLMTGAAALALSAGMAAAQQTEVRIAWYNDGNEGEVLADLIERFEEANPDIDVVIDTVAYQAILESLPVQLAAGEGPDMARVTDLGGLAEYYLDLRPYLEDPAYWEASFGPFLNWLRVPGNEDAIHGYMTQLTVTGPFVNKTLFEQAGVELPGAGATWEDWAEASRQVAEATGVQIPIAIDRSGHRIAGPAISMGAAYFDEAGEPAVVDEGFESFAQMLYDWHQDGTMAKDIFVAGSGGTYVPANQEFVNAQTVFYYSGSWQIGQFAQNIGQDFDWWAVPNPCGPAACSGMPGGAALVALEGTEHPEEVARVMEYLASPEVIAEFAGRTLFLPGHLQLNPTAIDFQTDNPLAEHALQTFAAEVPKVASAAYALQGYTNNRIVFNATIARISEAIGGEMSLEDAFGRIETDIENQLTEAAR